MLGKHKVERLGPSFPMEAIFLEKPVYFFDDFNKEKDTIDWLDTQCHTNPYARGNMNFVSSCLRRLVKQQKTT